jgi:hypothetical protein
MISTRALKRNLQKHLKENKEFFPSSKMMMTNNRYSDCSKSLKSEINTEDIT